MTHVHRNVFEGVTKKHNVRGESCARTGMNSPSAVWRPSPQVYRYALTLGSTTCAWSSYAGETQQRQCPQQTGLAQHTLAAT